MHRQTFACGFLFSTDRRRVLLIRKRRPAWQVGKLNGIGGKIEPSESPIQAMEREFFEEAQLRITGWQEVLQLKGSDWQAHFFRGFGAVDDGQAGTDELLEIHPADPVPADVIPNLRWMIPLMLDEEPMGGKYAIQIPHSLPAAYQS